MLKINVETIYCASVVYIAWHCTFCAGVGWPSIDVHARIHAVQFCSAVRLQHPVSRLRQKWRSRAIQHRAVWCLQCMIVIKWIPWFRSSDIFVIVCVFSLCSTLLALPVWKLWHTFGIGVDFLWLIFTAVLVKSADTVLTFKTLLVFW